MGKELTVAQENQIVDFDYKAKATEWLQNMGTQLPKQQTAQFLELCQAYKLNPFKREIYAVGYKDKFNIIVGYEVYLKRAERTGKLDGWKCVTNDNNTKARVTIYRKDWKYPFEHEVLLNEVKQNSPIWQKMQTFMMKKVCIEQGFRLCFPDEMGGMPYGEEEVPYDRVIATENVRDVTPPKEEPTAEAIESELQEQQSIQQSKERMELKRIVEKYENALAGVPYNLSCQALADNDPAKINELLNRVKKHQ